MASEEAHLFFIDLFRKERRSCGTEKEHFGYYTTNIGHFHYILVTMFIELSLH